MHTSQTSNRHTWAIFCRVVDNLGDIGVCWRLARTLALYHEQRVQLWVDDLDAYFRLCPDARQVGSTFVFDNVEVCLWREPFPPVACADVVVEAFSCDPPASYVQAMAARKPAPVWINLEYLSAEDWVEGVHRMSSPHPRLPLLKHFYCPGFTPATGGLLREPDLLERRAAHQSSPTARSALFESLGVDGATPVPLTISMFAYGHPGLGDLLHQWARGDEAVRLLVPQGRMLDAVARQLGVDCLQPGARVQRDALEVTALPFLPQTDYDRLLWSCDLNFVRGEDSFVRAQWAARPLVWQIYAQDERAHEIKLSAFLRRYTAGLDAVAAEAVGRLWRAWNGQGELAASWPAFAAALPAQQRYARAWSDELARQQDLATTLVNFCKGIVKSRVF